jgi:hypothetical protein
MKSGKAVSAERSRPLPESAPKRSAGCPRFAPAYLDFLLRSTRQDRVCGFL